MKDGLWLRPLAAEFLVTVVTREPMDQKLNKIHHYFQEVLSYCSNCDTDITRCDFSQ
jgi:hypothetical protein